MRLFNDYCGVDSDIKLILKEKCDEFLEHVNSEKIGKEMPDSLYLVRCQIVHRMYVIDDFAREILAEIDDLFLDTVIQLVLSFSVANNLQDSKSIE